MPVRVRIVNYFEFRDGEYISQNVNNKSHLRYFCTNTANIVSPFQSKQI